MISLFLAVSRFGDAALDTISSSLTGLCFFLLRSCASLLFLAESHVSGTLRLILFHLHLNEYLSRKPTVNYTLRGINSYNLLTGC
jgi:hypothetical protein